MERFADQPFALLFINTVDDADHIRKQTAEHGITWPSIWEPDPGSGLPAKWGVRWYPTIYVLDAQGVIRFIDVRGEALAEVVETLLNES